MIHMCNSLTKSYMGTAIGVAIGEGLLKLDDRLIDIFPEYAPENPSEFLKELTLEKTLCFGTGMMAFPSEEGNWVKNFINQEIVHKPGTAFRYNSVASTFLGKIILKKTGMNVYDYLNEKLFKKIGIDYDRFDYGLAPEGKDMWAWRAVSTTEDNLRLMKVYLDGGRVNGEQIIPEEYCRLATTTRIDNAVPELVAVNRWENCSGYGFQIWMCTYPGSYRADGAGGQFCVVLPDKDMIVSINEETKEVDTTLENIWKYLVPAVEAEDAIEENPEALKKLRRRMSTMAIPAPQYTPYAACKNYGSGRYKILKDSFNLFTTGMAVNGEVVPVDEVDIEFRVTDGTITWIGKNRTRCTIDFALDGSRRFNRQDSPWEFARYVYVNGVFENENTMRLELLWPENDNRRTLQFEFFEGGLKVHETKFVPNMGRIVTEVIGKKL